MPRDISKQAALRVAQQLYGKNARVRVDTCYMTTYPKNTGKPTCSAAMLGGGHPKDCTGEKKVYIVGAIRLGGLFFEIRGIGSTFREALERARKKEGK